MKKSSILAAALLMAACSPQVYPLYLDVRQPSSSGLDLSRKNIAIAYMEGADTLFDRQAASSLARSLEADYFGGQQTIGLYKVPATDSLSLDTMHSLVMDTEGDVVFVMNSKLGEAAPESNQPVRNAASVDSAYVCPVAVPIATSLQIYDSMGEDKILNFKGSTVLRSKVYNSGMLTDDGIKTLARNSMAEQAEEIGERISKRFLSRWKTESFSFYYFDGLDSDKWLDALQHAADGEFKKAVDGWTPLVKSGSNVKRACAAYNIAMAFYLLDDYTLSSKWLEYAEKLENVSLGAGLRTRLKSKLEKL